MYYSPQTGGFYNREIHGHPTLSVPDPAWQRPVVSITLQPGESFPTATGALTNESEATLELEAVEDWRIAHPLIEIANPDYRIPADAVEISPETHAALLAGQSAGQRIVPGADGHPILIDPPAPSTEELAASARQRRTTLLSASDWTVLADAPLTSTQKTLWKAYRQALRDIPDQAGFPAEIVWPEQPQ